MNKYERLIQIILVGGSSLGLLFFYKKLLELRRIRAKIAHQLEAPTVREVDHFFLQFTRLTPNERDTLQKKIHASLFSNLQVKAFSLKSKPDSPEIGYSGAIKGYLGSDSAPKLNLDSKSVLVLNKSVTTQGERHNYKLLSDKLLRVLFHPPKPGKLSISKLQVKSNWPGIQIGKADVQARPSERVTLHSHGSVCDLGKFWESLSPNELADLRLGETSVRYSRPSWQMCAAPLLAVAGLLPRSFKLDMSSSLESGALAMRESQIDVKMACPLVFVGEFTFKNGLLRADRVDCFGKSLRTIFLSLDERIKAHKSRVVAISSALGVFFVSKLIWAMIKRKRERKIVQKEILKEQMEFISNEIESDFKCVICFQYPRNLIFRPCNHFVTCSICFDSMSDTAKEKKNCLMCKQSIDKIIRLDFITSK